jgi:putative beta-barrel porin BBP2
MTPCVLLLSAAVLAQDQDNPLLKIGPVSIQPSLVLQNIGEDPNVFNSATDPQSDFTMTISPKINVVFAVRKSKTTFAQTADYVYFKKFSSERGTNYSYVLREDVDLGIFQPFGYVSTLSSKNRINNEVDERARHDNTDYSVGTVVNVFTRTHASFKARRSRTTFDPNETFRGESLSRAFDGVLRGFDTSAGVALTPFTSFDVVFTDEQQRFDFAPERNSDTFRVMPTLSFSPLGLLNGTAALGYRRFTPKDPSVPDYHGFVAQVTAGVTVRDRHRLSTTITRDVSYSYDQTAVYYLQNSVGGSWAYQIGRGFDSLIGATRNLMHYHQTATTGPADDIYTSYDLAFGYRILPRLRASLNGTFSKRKSEVSPDRAYDSNRVYGTVTWGG